MSTPCERSDAFGEALDMLSGLKLDTGRLPVSLWPLVDICVRMGDDFAAVVHLNPSLDECRRVMHEYHGVRATIIDAFNELGIDQGCGHGDPVSIVLRQGHAFAAEFIRNPSMLLAADVFVNDEASDGFVRYALAEFAWCRFEVEFL